MDIRVLLADNSRFFRTIERQFLQKTPVAVIEAANSDELFAKLPEEKPHLLFLAYDMRPLDGVECCRRIKADPSLRTMPIVMVCDQDVAAQVASAQQAGCDAVLVKPLDRQRFLQAGRQFLSGIREHRVPCFMPVSFDWEGSSKRGKSLDISSGGLFVESEVDIPVGTIITISFVLPGTNVPMTCKGKVAWHNRRPNLLKPHYPTGFGIKFKELPQHFDEQFRRIASR